MAPRSTRRKFLAAGIAGVVAPGAYTPSLATGSGKANIVVVGGGAGGATAAKYVALMGGEKVNVTLVEANQTYQSCFFSNHYIGGLRDFTSLSHRYDELQTKTAIRLIVGQVTGIDRDRKTVTLHDTNLPYDLLILAPGIDFIEDSVKGWSPAAQNSMPHAYRGGNQARLLAEQIRAMPEGGVFAIVPPAGKYRCPPGPYERVCVVANLLNRINPRAKIIIADPKPVFSKMGLFREAWKKHYKPMISMNSDVDMTTFRVDPDAMTITLDSEVINVDVCNVIPAQRAGKIAHLAGITENGWAPVHAEDMRSRIDSDIYVVGDAAEQGEMPKSAYSANSQARVCADAIISRLSDSEPRVPRFENTCWSFLADNDSVKIGASYESTEQGIKKLEGFVSRRKESAAVRQQTFEESLDWYAAITRDMFHVDN